MVTQDDLAAGVAQGIITDAQATALHALAATREKARIAELGHEERFRFMRGFNDFFFATGVLLFGLGTRFFAGPTPIGNLVAAAMMWALAELLVARMRLVLPGILLAILFVSFVFVAVPVDWLDPAVTARPIRPAVVYPWVGWIGSAGSVTVAAKGLIAGAAALAFYARFRLPFALLLVAGGLVIAVMMAARLIVPQAANAAMAAVLLLCGLAVFAAAMAFDISDRERVSRRSDCAFWLHLLAAPLIVHSLISLATDDAFATMTDGMAAAIVGIVAVLAMVAIVIDRRALLVSTFTYLGIVIAYALKAASVDQAVIFAATLLVLGAMVLALGVGWLPLRRVLIGVSSARIAAHLPPVVPAA
jgi:hypothetical protein